MCVWQEHIGIGFVLGPGPGGLSCLSPGCGWLSLGLLACCTLHCPCNFAAPPSWPLGLPGDRLCLVRGSCLCMLSPQMTEGLRPVSYTHLVWVHVLCVFGTLVAKRLCSLNGGVLISGSVVCMVLSYLLGIVLCPLVWV